MKQMHRAVLWGMSLAAALVPAAAWAQATATTVVTLENKGGAPVDPASLSIQVDGKNEAVIRLEPLQPVDTQVAILIDDGLRSSIGRQLDDIASFIRGLPAGTQVMVGYMQNGRVVGSPGFTTNHEEAAGSLRLSMGIAGIDASPYFSLSTLAKGWPREGESYGTAGRQAAPRARFVLLITSGVDPYNGSVSPLNQNSPYVDAAIRDSQRAGLNVYSIYYGQVGIRGGLASFSGQSYLSQVAEATGGELLYQLRGAPPSLSPYLKNFQDAINESELATFAVPGGKDLIDLRVKTKQKGLKVRATRAVKAAAE